MKAEGIAFPDKKYQIIYADPPWRFSPMGIDPDKIHKSLATHTAAENHYSTMTLDEIKELDIKSISDKQSILFMWTTAPFLSLALDVINDWGFKYKTVAFVWAKRNKEDTRWANAGGWYTLSQTELCLLGTKGKTIKRNLKNQKQLIIAPRSKHSRKPDEARIRIENIYGNIPRIELFARERVEGWDAWGLEV